MKGLEQAKEPEVESKRTLEHTLPDDSGREDHIELPDDSGQEDHIELPDDSGEEDDIELPDDSGREDDVKSSNESDENESVSRIEPPVVVLMKCPEGCDPKEFERQVKAQEAGMNKLSVAEYQRNRSAYGENGRNISAGNDAQQEVREKARQDRIAENQDCGMSYSEAVGEADKWLKTKDALHDPDQIAGGNPSNVTGLGDSNVNRSIGSQWRGKIESVDNEIADAVAANEMTQNDCEKTKMNVTIKVVN